MSRDAYLILLQLLLLFTFQVILLQLLLLFTFQASSLPNLALLGTASQSASHSFGPASNANDGNRSPEFLDGSCSHTVNGPYHWWSLLLPEKYSIKQIVIFNRNVLAERLNNAEILIGNSQDNNGNNNPRCAVVKHIPAAGYHTYNCRGMVGRLVNVKLFDTVPESSLTLCELEVYGEPAAPSFSAVVMGVSVAVVDKKLCWSDALFYCRDFYWDLLSVRSEEEQGEVENVLRSVSFNLTGHVWLGLRRYLMDGIWFWMSGTTEIYTNWETQSSWEITSPCGGMDTSSPFHWRDLPCEVHHKFICLKDTQNNKKRVEFFSSTRP